jgi:hypothetical protein
MNKSGWRQKTGITDWTFGTWNVQTVLQLGKMMEIGDEVLKLGIDPAALQEIRWKAGCNKTQRKTKNEMAG